jgi:CelD/BcsL family acetyltransferase involved in cellulose biosynthesis
MVRPIEPPRSAPVAESPAASPTGVVATDPIQDQRWLDFVSNHPDALVYHHPLWLRALHAEYGQELIGLMNLDAAGNCTGVLPLVRTRGLPLGFGGDVAGKRLSSLPRTPVAGPLVRDAAAAKALVHSAVAMARHEPGTRLQIKVAAPMESLDEPALVSTRWRESFVVEVPPRDQPLRFGPSRNHGRIRWAVAKSEREGVRVREAATDADLVSWYRLYLDTMRWHLVPARSLRFFRVLFELARPAGLARLLLAEVETPSGTQAIAGSIFLSFGATVFYAFNGRRQSALPLRPNDAILWHAIHRAQGDGFARFDLGEVSHGHIGLAEFKSKWAATSSWLHRYSFPSERGDAQADAGTDPGADAASDAPGLVRRLARAGWRRMPLAATALIGERVYSYL